MGLRGLIVLAIILATAMLDPLLGRVVSRLTFGKSLITFASLWLLHPSLDSWLSESVGAIEWVTNARPGFGFRRGRWQSLIRPGALLQTRDFRRQCSISCRDLRIRGGASAITASSVWLCRLRIFRLSLTACESRSSATSTLAITCRRGNCASCRHGQ